MELAWLRVGAHVALILLANVLIAVLLATRGRIGRIPHYPLATAALILFAFWLIGLALSVRGLAFSVRGDIVPFLVATESGAACPCMIPCGYNRKRHRMANQGHLSISSRGCPYFLLREL